MKNLFKNGFTEFLNYITLIDLSSLTEICPYAIHLFIIVFLYEFPQNDAYKYMKGDIKIIFAFNSKCLHVIILRYFYVIRAQVMGRQICFPSPSLGLHSFHLKYNLFLSFQLKYIIFFKTHIFKMHAFHSFHLKYRFFLKKKYIK